MENRQNENEAVSEARLVLVKLESQLKTTSKRIETLTAKRRPLALAAQIGDSDARRDLDLLTEEQHKLYAEIDDIRLALGEARAHVATAEQAAHAADANARLAEARKIEAEFLCHADRFDQNIIAAAKELRVCEHCRTRLARTGAIEPKYLNSLASKLSVQRAVGATALAKFLDHIGASSRMSLLDSSRGVLSAIRRPTVNTEAPLATSAHGT